MFEIKKMHYLSLLSCSDDQENFAKLKSRFNDFAKVTILRIGGDKKTRIRDQDMSASFFLLQNFEQQQQKRNKPSKEIVPKDHLKSFSAIRTPLGSYPYLEANRHSKVCP